MKIYAIGDLHLSFTEEKPMDVFGANWDKHYDKIKENWLKKINNDDLILLPGDTSWAIDLEKAKVDLGWIDDLPGRKIILKGNHDYWWTTLKKMKSLFESIEYLHNNYIPLEGMAICGSRGWVCPNDSYFTEHDDKIYRRELLRLESSIKEAVKDGYDDIIVMLHYPPTNDQKDGSGFTEIIEKYKVNKVIYGHLHSKEYFDLSYKGLVNGTNYYLVSSDAIEFDPLLILDEGEHIE